MELEPCDRRIRDLIWNEYFDIITEMEPGIIFDHSSRDCQRQPGEGDKGVMWHPRGKFYLHAKEAYAVVHTGETAQYGNIILTKGIVKEF